MMRSFLSEWVKLLRVRQLFAVWGTMAALMVLFTVLIFANAAEPAPPPAACTANPPDLAACQAALAEAAQSPRRGPAIPIASLEEAGGLTSVLGFGGSILGIITLVVFAGNLAAEYSNGTLKLLLSRQPRRLMLLGGKLTALASFAIAGVTIAALAQMLAAVAVASARGFDTSAWWTAENLGNAIGLIGRLWGAMLVWGALGTVLAILLRSGPAAIGIGIGYVLVGEGLLSLALPDVVRYLPGQVISAFVALGKASAQGGSTNPVDFGLSIVLMAVYLVLFLGVAGGIFRSRDVST